MIVDGDTAQAAIARSDELVKFAAEFFGDHYGEGTFLDYLRRRNVERYTLSGHDPDSMDATSAGLRRKEVYSLAP